LPTAYNPWEHVTPEGAKYVRYKHGVRMFWQRQDMSPPPEGAATRDVIRDQSRASRHRSAFAFGNAECSWAAMATLTWHALPNPDAVKKALTDLRREWRKTWEESMDGWIMEMQQRGAPHFHLFIAAESLVGKTVAVMPVQTLTRKGRARRIVRGSFDQWIVETWLRVTGQDADDDAIAFHEGGIVELFDSADAAGRYVAKESCKREQKVLPDIYAEGLGRWWWLNRAWKPLPRERGSVVGEWPFEGPMKHVWEASKIAGILGPEDETPVPAGRKYELRPGRAMPMAPLKLPPGQLFLGGVSTRCDAVFYETLASRAAAAKRLAAQASSSRPHFSAPTLPVP